MKAIDLRDTFIVTTLVGAWPQSRSELGPTYVRKLQAMCRASIPGIPFICFTDREIPGVCTRYLPPWLPGWWGKLYAFAPSCFPLGSRVLVMDLDTVVRDLHKVLAVDLSVPVFIRDAYMRLHAGSGIFSFRTSRETARVWLDFPHGSNGPPFKHPATESPLGLKLTDEHWLHHYIMKRPGGISYQNQQIIWDAPLGGWRGWDELLPGRVLSYKHDLNQSCEPLPDDCDIVFFDGEPRPHDVVADWNPHNIHGAAP